MVFNSIKFKEDYHNLKAGLGFDLLDGTLFVGNQGAGKTSFLDALRLRCGLGKKETWKERKQNLTFVEIMKAESFTSTTMIFEKIP